MPTTKPPPTMDGSPADDLTTLSICTWLYADSADEESTYPQMPGRSSSQAFQDGYWRCVAVFFATSHRHQPQAKHVLFTNVERIPSVTGVDVGALLERLGVEIVHTPLTYTHPGRFHSWRNQFYVFDILTYLAREIGEGDAAIVLDSDCVWITNAGPIHAALRRDGVLTYVENYSPEWIESGLTREDMRALSSELLGYEIPHPLVYCGGEILAATAPELRRLSVEIASTWSELMDRHARGETIFNEEAQTLSHIYYKLCYPLGNAAPFIRRIWTGSFGVLNTASPHDAGLVVWHLPLEKRLGLRRLFAAVADPTSNFWSVELGRELRDYLGDYLGVPRNTIAKRIKDLARRVSDAARYR